MKLSFLTWPHVILGDQNANNGSPTQPPTLADEFELRFDVVGQKGHVVGKVEIGVGEDQRVAKDCLATHAIDLSRKKH